MTELGQRPTPPGWFPDPDGTPNLRLWDGMRWTSARVQAQVAGLAPSGFAPPGMPVAKEAIVPLPLVAAITAIVATGVSLTASKFLIEGLVQYRWPIAVYTAIAAIVGYGPLLLMCIGASRRWGTGSLRADLGVSFRRVDLGWGPVTWVACFLGQIVAAVVVVTTKLPFESNTEGLADRAGDRAYIIAFAILAVICAPIVEELVFRGVVLRGLLSRTRVWVAVGIQGVLFGAAHIDPVRGMKNVGLVLVLSSVGVVLGGAALLFRRLAPSMIAHALLNTVALIVILNN
ncbi:MAG: CPBP family glutamic-type intramembrane protease [Ilumatobacteraceae bacterium]